MVKISVLAACLAVVALSPALAAEPFGMFVGPSTGTPMKFYDCGGKLCGKIVGVKNASRSKEIGAVILKGAALGSSRSKAPTGSA